MSGGDQCFSYKVCDGKFFFRLVHLVDYACAFSNKQYFGRWMRHFRVILMLAHSWMSNSCTMILIFCRCGLCANRQKLPGSGEVGCSANRLSRRCGLQAFAESHGCTRGCTTCDSPTASVFSNRAIGRIFAVDCSTHALRGNTTRCRPGTISHVLYPRSLASCVACAQVSDHCQEL